MKIRTIIIILFVILLACLIFSRLNKDDNEKAKGPGTGGIPSATVAGVVLKAQKFSNNISVSGTIEANEQVEIRGEISGRIEEILFKEGTQVSKGQTLIRIDDTELRAQLRETLTKQELASENERRAALLLEKEAISREEYDIARADFKTAQAQTQLIQAQISKTVIKAPFSGRIGLRSVSEGSYLSPTTIIAKLINTNPAKITFSIPEKYARFAKANSIVFFNLQGSDEKFNAKIYAVEPEIETVTRTLRIRATADNANAGLLPGAFVNVEMPLSEIENALLVPTQAIIPVQNGKKVFISEKGKAKEVLITTGTRTEKDILVEQGLKEGDTVLTTGVMSLRTGTPVRVKVSK